jgi:hypothetical protein
MTKDTRDMMDAQIESMRDKRDMLAREISTMPASKFDTKWHRDRFHELTRITTWLRETNEMMGY